MRGRSRSEADWTDRGSVSRSGNARVIQGYVSHVATRGSAVPLKLNCSRDVMLIWPQVGTEVTTVGWAVECGTSKPTEVRS